MDLAREAVRRQPFGHGIGVEERSIDPLGGCTKYPLKFDGVLGHLLFSLVMRVKSSAMGNRPPLPQPRRTGKPQIDMAPFIFRSKEDFVALPLQFLAVTKKCRLGCPLAVRQHRRPALLL
jgi:hypothetical protein